MNPIDTIQATLLLELQELRKENADLKKERQKLMEAMSFIGGESLGVTDQDLEVYYPDTED